MIGVETYGTPTWVDLSTPDLDAAASFYTALLGWNIEAHHLPTGEYRIGVAAGHQVGGMMASPGQAASMAMWTVLFRVADVDATVSAVDGAGGEILEAPFDLPAARLAIVADPTGAIFGVISHASPTEAWLSSAPGAVCWVELLTRDVPAAIAFYATVFGWSDTTETFGDVAYTTFALDGDPVAGGMRMPAEVPDEVPGGWSAYFAVEDCAASERRSVELGGQVLRSTAPVDDGHFAVLVDPQGASFQLMDALPASDPEG